MKITCPVCNMVYNIPSHKIPEGRKVSTKCKKCGGRIVVDARVEKREATAPSSESVAAKETKAQGKELETVHDEKATEKERKGRSTLTINLAFFFIVTIAVAIGTAFFLKVDLKSFYGVGLTIGFWIFGAGFALCITLIPSGIYWFFKRKRMPGFSTILWISYIILATLCFIWNYDKDHSHVSGVKEAKSLSILGEKYFNQGKYAEAEPLYKQSLKIMEKALGPHHPEVGNTLNNLAALYRAQRKYAEAEPLYKRLLKIMEKDLGSHHPNVVNALDSLSQLYQYQKKYTDAEPLLMRSLEIKKKTPGLEHNEVAYSLSALAGNFWCQKNYTEAIVHWTRTLAILEESYGPSSPKLYYVLTLLADSYEKIGNEEEAVRLRERVNKIRSKKNK